MENGVKRDITRIYNWEEDILLRILACNELTPFGPCNRDCLLSILIVVLHHRWVALQPHVARFGALGSVFVCQGQKARI